MATVAEFEIKEQLQPTLEIAAVKGWEIESLDSTTLFVKLLASDKSTFALIINGKGFSTFPPSFHWCDPQTREIDQLKDVPKTNNRFFHGNGVICAPWNRLAYASENQKGPHRDWQIGNWMANPKTGGHKTLTAMLLRIDYELKHKYRGRMG